MHFQNLKRRLKKTTLNTERIQKAYAFAAKAHEGQKRKTGEDYITHPVAVAEKLLDFGADEESIIAALLHDTVEDTEATLEIVEKEFGKDVANIVDGLTKFEKHIFEDTEDLDEKIETIRKWLQAMNSDLRIAIIKLADRLDNLDSLNIFRAEKRMRISQETIDIYARVAKWLSLEDIREELECLSFPYVLQEGEYTDVLLRKKETEEAEGSALKIIQKYFEKKEHPPVKAEFIQHPVSIQEIYFSPDLPTALYCIVDKEDDAYRMLSFFHKHWCRKKYSFQDYINTPKINGYQALHTSIIVDGDQRIKVKIMTKEMYEYHRKGVLLSCFQKKKYKIKLPWMEKMQELLEVNKEKSYEFWRGIQSDLLGGFILVHGPNAQTVSIPIQSTYLDAAFAFLKKEAIYVSAIISNGKEISPRRRIKDGARVSFIKSKQVQVTHDWLHAVDNISSMHLIKEGMRNRNDAEKIELGRKMLQEEFNRYNLGLVEEMNEEILLGSSKKDVTSLNDLFKKIGEVFISPAKIVHALSTQKISGTLEKRECRLRCSVRKDVLGKFFSLLGSSLVRVKLFPCIKKKRFLTIFVFLLLTEREEQRLSREIRREPNMSIIDTNTELHSRVFSWITVIFLAILWGVGLVLADYLIEYKDIEPMLFSASRLWTVALLMGVILFIQLQKSNTSSKPINMRHWSFFASVFTFAGIPIFTYLALEHATPSQYVLFMLTHSVYVLFVTMLEKRAFDIRYVLPITLLMLLGSYFFIIDNPAFSPIGKLYIILSVLSFGGYSYASNYYASRLGVKARYPKFLAVIALLGALIASISYAIFAGVVPTLENLSYTILYSIFFPGTAYLLYYILINREGYSSMVGYSFFFFLLTTYTCQTLFLSETIFQAEWMALPFLGAAVILSAKYFNILQEKSKNN